MRWAINNTERATQSDGAGDMSMTWTVDELRKDGEWVRRAWAHAWESNADAHNQKDELAKRFTKRIYAVRKMTENDANCV